MHVTSDPYNFKEALCNVSHFRQEYYLVNIQVLNTPGCLLSY